MARGASQLPLLADAKAEALPEELLDDDDDDAEAPNGLPRTLEAAKALSVLQSGKNNTTIPRKLVAGSK